MLMNINLEKQSMKKVCWLICWLACVAGVARADSVRFSETYTESLKSFTDGEITEYFTVARVKFSASGSLTIPGLSNSPLNQLTNFSMEIGGYNYAAEVSAASSATSNKLVFPIVRFIETEEESLEVVAGSITLRRAGEVLAFSLSAEKLDGEFSMAAANHADPGESGTRTRSVNGETRFAMILGSEELSFERTLYYKGTASYQRVRRGSGEEAETFTLPTVTLNGSADYQKPAISITSPKPNQRITNNVFLITGTAKDNGEVSEVHVRVNDGEFEGADFNIENGVWSTLEALTLRPGTNVIEAFALDADGNMSGTTKVKCFRVLTNALTLTYQNGNRVTGVSNRQVLEVGRGYKATAKPGSTNLFLFWSNSVSGLKFSNATLRFQMQEDLALEARFIPNPWLPNVGKYNGLFLPIAGVDATNSGFITLQLTDKGKVTGKLTQGTRTRGFMGQVDIEGNALIHITSAPALTLQFMFHLADGSGTVEGSVTGDGLSSSFQGERQSRDPALVGKHTFAIPGAPAEESTNRPAGDGAGVLTIKADGSVTLAGNLGEGTPLTAGSGISKAGRLPIHAVQFGGKGLFLGWLSVSTSAPPITVRGASLNWVKSSGMASQKTYPDGFNEPNKSLMGARYTPPPRGTNGLNWTDGVVLLDGGRLTSTISNVLTVAGTRLAAPGNSNQIVLTLTASSGRLSGSFLHPASNRSTPLNGYVLQQPDGDAGKGWFISTNESGFLDLHKLVP
jgi:Bacterial Ig domain